MGVGAILALTVAFILLRDRVLPPEHVRAPGTVETKEPEKLSSSGAEEEPAPSEPEGEYVSRNVFCLSIFDALKRTIPPSVWLTAIRSEDNGGYVLEGIAFSQNRVEEFAQNLQGEAAVHTSSAQISDEETDEAFRFVVKGTLSSPEPSAEGRLRPLSKERAHDLGRAIRREGEMLGLRFVGPPATGRIAESKTPVLWERLYAEGMDTDVAAFLDYLMKELYEPLGVSHLAIAPKDRGGGAGRLDLVLTLHFHVLD